MNRLWTLSWATLVTLMRIALAPFIGICLLNHCWTWSCILLFVAAATDCIDGYIARNFKQESLLGSYLDPLADKLVLMMSYSALSFIQMTAWNIPAWFLVLVLLREGIMITVGIWVLYTAHSMPTMQPTIWGKLATVCHLAMLVIGCGSLAHLWNIPLAIIQHAIWPIATCMTVSALQYSRTFLRYWTAESSYL